jgi:hypothetical protein
LPWPCGWLPPGEASSHVARTLKQHHGVHVVRNWGFLTIVSPNLLTEGPHKKQLSSISQAFFYFAVLGLEFRVYTLSHSASPFFVKGFFRIGSQERTISLQWLQRTSILLISASWVARITGVSQWHLAGWDILFWSLWTLQVICAQSESETLSSNQTVPPKQTNNNNKKNPRN